jgi:hypothetical protein
MNCCTASGRVSTKSSERKKWMLGYGDKKSFIKGSKMVSME